MKNNDRFNNKRRDFVANSAKIGTALGVSALLGGNVLWSADLKSNKSVNPNKKSTQMQFTTLNNGAKMPLVGFGTWLIRGVECQKSVENALSVGYRLIDTAQMYGNESEVGKAIKASGVARNELFITTKLSSDMNYSESLKAIDESLRRIGVNSVDLMLIHKPYTQYKEMYKAMVKAHKDGKIKSLGVSNFTPNRYNELLKTCEIIPAVNQMETHLFNQQRELRALMQKSGTKLEAWSPFAKGSKELFNNEVLVSVAKKHNKTPAQVALRFLIEQDIIVIPKTTKIERMRENIALFDFALDDSDKKALYVLDRGEDMYRWFDSKIMDFLLKFS